MARLGVGELPPALEDLSHAIELDPRSADLYDKRAFVLVRLGRYDAALADFDTAARLQPDYALTFVLRGGLYERIDGDKRRACAEWQSACRLGDCNLFQKACAGR